MPAVFRLCPRKTAATAALVLATTTAALLPQPTAFAVARESITTHSGATTDQGRRQVDAYWTPERMKLAGALVPEITPMPRTTTRPTIRIRCPPARLTLGRLGSTGARWTRVSGGSSSPSPTATTGVAPQQSSTARTAALSSPRRTVRGVSGPPPTTAPGTKTSTSCLATATVRNLSAASASGAWPLPLDGTPIRAGRRRRTSSSPVTTRESLWPIPQPPDDGSRRSQRHDLEHRGRGPVGCER